QQTFESSYAGRWDEFAQWLSQTDKSRKSAPRSGDAPAFDMPARYRELCQQLALARDRQYSADLIDRLSGLALRGHQILYGVRIGFQTFASGLLFGVGALFYLIYNGIFIGAFTGYIIDAGFATNFFSFTSGHSSFELLAICLSGAAGLKLGYALIAPARLTRA